MKKRKGFRCGSVGLILLLGITMLATLPPINTNGAEIENTVENRDTQNTEVSTETDNSTESSTELPEEEPKPVLNGLIRDSKGDLYFYAEGVKIKNKWKKVKGYKYYFGEKGKAYTGKRKINNNIYYFDSKGRQKNGWITIDKKTYYFSPKNGTMVTGKKTISHYLCYFSEKGVLTRKIDKNKKMVALTYDDGPSIYTPRILKTLEENDSVATFFVVGNRVPKYSKSVKKAYSMGCQIGNHSYEHKNLTRVSQKEVKRQMDKTNRAIKKITGEEPVIMRPPGGATNRNVKSWVGMPSIIWSVDTLDWKTRNAQSTKNAVLNHVRDGDIVLMHDLYESTAKASQTIIPALVERGYQLVTVSELAECRGGMKDTGAYHNFRK